MFFGKYEISWGIATSDVANMGFLEILLQGDVANIGFLEILLQGDVANKKFSEFLPQMMWQIRNFLSFCHAKKKKWVAERPGWDDFLVFCGIYKKILFCATQK